MSGASLNGVPEEPARRFVIVESDRFDTDRDGAILSVYRALGPERANDWAQGLARAIFGLTGFPGPLSHARDEEASAFYGREVRRLLYHGPTRRRSGTPIRLLFTILLPDPAEPPETAPRRAAGNGGVGSLLTAPAARGADSSAGRSF